MSTVRGDARRNPLEYQPGQPVIESIPADEGKYLLSLKSKGKPGRAGWKVKPGKYPNRRCVFTIHGTEDEVTGEEKTVTVWFTLHPTQLKQVQYVAAAVEYPNPFTFPNYKKPTDAAVQEAAEIVDSIVDYIEENGLQLGALLGQEEFNNQMNNRVQKWMPAAAVEGDAGESPAPEEAEAAEEEATAEAEEGDEADAPDEEEEAEIVPPPRKAAAKPLKPAAGKPASKLPLVKGKNGKK